MQAKHRLKNIHERGSVVKIQTILVGVFFSCKSAGIFLQETPFPCKIPAGFRLRTTENKQEVHFTTTPTASLKSTFKPNAAN